MKKIPLILVVETHYVMEVYDVHVIAGNTALLSCVVPVYVKPYVTVISWIRDDAYDVFPTTRGGKWRILLQNSYRNFFLRCNKEFDINWVWVVIKLEFSRIKLEFSCIKSDLILINLECKRFNSHLSLVWNKFAPPPPPFDIKNFPRLWRILFIEGSELRICPRILTPLTGRIKGIKLSAVSSLKCSESFCIMLMCFI